MAPKKDAQSIRELREILDELKKVKNEEAGKILEVEQEYLKIRRAVYKRRNEIISSIPDFWLTAFLNHPLLLDLLTDDDQKIFKHLILFDVDESEDVKSGYSFTLNFSPNPYFEDACLSKAYTFNDDGSVTVTGATIKWKEGMYKRNGNDIREKNDSKPANSVERLPLPFIHIYFSERKRVNCRFFWAASVFLSFFGWLSETQQLNISEWHGDEIAAIIKEDLYSIPLEYYKKR